MISLNFTKKVIKASANNSVIFKPKIQLRGVFQSEKKQKDAIWKKILPTDGDETMKRKTMKQLKTRIFAYVKENCDCVVSFARTNWFHQVGLFHLFVWISIARNWFSVITITSKFVFSLNYCCPETFHNMHFPCGRNSQSTNNKHVAFSLLLEQWFCKNKWKPSKTKHANLPSLASDWSCGSGDSCLLWHYIHQNK